MRLNKKGQQLASTCLLLMVIGGAAFLAYSVRVPIAVGEGSTTSSGTEGGSPTSSSTSGSYTQSATGGSATFTTSSSHSESEGESSSGTFTGASEGVVFRLVPVNGSFPGVPVGYRVGNGSADVQAGEGGLDIHLHLIGMNPATEYSLVDLINGTARVVGNFTSAYDGESEFEASVSLPSGSYLVGLSVSDVSTLSSGFKVLQSIPATQQVSVVQGSEGESESSSEAITTQTLGEGEQGEIDEAIRNNTIPFVVQVSGGNVDFSVTDHNFTIFAGVLNGNGIQISVSGQNGTSSRVLLVNLSGSQGFLDKGTLLVKYDGAKVQEASSLSQVFGVKPADSPTFVVVSSASGIQLFISIPHFSSHVIKILQAVIQSVTNALAVDWPLFVVSLAVVTLVFATVYARRTKLYV